MFNFILNMNTLDNSVYLAHGFSDRNEYLQYLADDYGKEAVDAISSVLPDTEDFDGLVTELEEFSFIFD
jgi:hypothetical protein